VGKEDVVGSLGLAVGEAVFERRGEGVSFRAGGEGEELFVPPPPLPPNVGIRGGAGDRVERSGRECVG